jgi:hypothetical protein
MPPTTFEWGPPADENWRHTSADDQGQILYGLGVESVAQALVSMRGAMITDMNGDLANEILLRRDGTGATSTDFWRPHSDDHSFALGLPSPPALPSYLDDEIVLDWLSNDEISAALLLRVQPPLTATVVNADGDRRSDILTPRSPFGNAVDLDPDG